MHHTPEQLLNEATKALENLYLIGLAIEQLPQKDAEWVTLKVANFQEGIEDNIINNITPQGDC